MHEPTPTLERRVDWPAVAIGFAAAAVAQGGLILWFLAAHPGDGVLQASATFLAVLAGGFVAGKLAARHGTWNGMMVAVVFIVAGALWRTLAEAALARPAGSGVWHMGGVILDDVLQLAAGTLGGWLGRRP